MMVWSSIIILAVILMLIARKVDKGSNEATRLKVFEVIKKEREQKQKKFKEIKELESSWEKRLP